jgi:hypothetical protein
LTRQCSNFTMNKLQDAYECDLDLGDTVKSIFGGETDPTMRMIKVVPSFINRDFSVPPTSNLRPHNAHKRPQEVAEEHVSKRRRVEQAPVIQDGMEMDVARDQPVPSTENSRNGSRGRSDHPSSRARSQPRRSQTESSVLIVHGAQTGEAEFAPAVKQESPELGLQPPARPVPHAEPTSSAAQDAVSRRQSTREPSRTSRATEEAVADPQQEPEITETADDEIEQADKDSQEDVAPLEIEQMQEPDVQETATIPSPQPMLDPPAHSPQRATTKRKDVYDVPSSPEILAQRDPKSTRARSTRTTNTVRKEVNLLNSSRLSSSQAHSGSSDPVSAFLKDIAQLESSEIQTPVKALLKPAKPGSLKKPTRKSLPVSNASKDSPTSSNEGKKMDPDIQARLDKIKQLRMGTRSSSKETPRKRSPSKETPGKNTQAAPWNAESWGYGNLQQPNGTAKETNGTDNAEMAINAQSNGAHESDGEPVTETHVNGTAQEPDEELEPEPQTALEEADESKSRSVSAAVSTRSSPVVSRRPARFLSHSPTPVEGSPSDDDSEEPTAAPSKPASAQPAIEEEAGSDGDSSSDSSSEDEDDDDDDDDDEEEEPAKPTPSLPPPSTAVLHSSPPIPTLTPSLSNPRPASTQPPIRRTPIPLPPNVSSQQVPSSQQIPSSQSVSVEAAARRPAARPATRYSGFRTLREQLADAKSPTSTVTKAPYDPRMVALSKLSKGKGAVVGDEESSDEESSSSSDSD